MQQSNIALLSISLWARIVRSKYRERKEGLNIFAVQAISFSYLARYRPQF